MRMKIKDARAGVLTNFEVLDLLQSRGATSDPMGALRAVSPSECKVFDYLVKGAAHNQTREIINEFLKRCEKFDLAKAEKLNIINIRPSSQAGLFSIIDDCEKRLGGNELEDLMNLVIEALPPPPNTGGEDQQEVQKQ